jgi:hypothetical protein
MARLARGYVDIFCPCKLLLERLEGCDFVLLATVQSSYTMEVARGRELVTLSCARCLP